MFGDDDDDDEDLNAKPLWVRVGVPVAGLAVIVVIVVAGISLLRGHGPAPRPHQEQHITQVMLPPRPPPTPPKPPTPEQPKKLEERPKENVPTPQKTTVPKDVPKAPTPPAAVTTSITGSGPGSLAAGNGSGGDCIGEGCGTGGGSSDNDAYYSNLVKTQIQDVLRRDEKLRNAKFTTRVTFRLNPSGRYSNLDLAEFSGDPEAKAEIQRQLVTLSTNDTPPPDMSGKIFTVRVTGRERG